MHTDDPAARRRARAAWPVRAVRRGEEPVDPPVGTPEDRLAAVWELTLQAWGVAGIELPRYARGEAPIRRLRLCDDVE
jgi:hypothetical protein